MRYLFPMYVVKVSDFLQMRGVPEPHHVLKRKGLLHEWQPGMFVSLALRLSTVSPLVLCCQIKRKKPSDCEIGMPGSLPKSFPTQIISLKFIVHRHLVAELYVSPCQNPFFVTMSRLDV